MSADVDFRTREGAREQKPGSRDRFSVFADWIDQYERYILPAPALIVVFAMLIFPVAFTIYLSFHKWSAGIAPPRFIGLDNFLEMAVDDRFWNGLKRTLIFVTVAVGSQTLLGLLTALVFHQRFRGRGLARSFFMFPLVATPAAMALVWKMMFDPTIGVLSYLLSSVGLPSPLWTASKNTALLSLTLVDTWQWTPLVMIIVLAGLAALPEELYEAAQVDGASAWSSFWHITLPLLRPTIMVAVMFRLIDAIKTFDIIIVITSGGPGYASETINIYAFKETLNNLHLGYGSSLLVVLGILVFGVSFLLSRIRRGEAW